MMRVLGSHITRHKVFSGPEQHDGDPDERHEGPDEITNVIFSAVNQGCSGSQRQAKAQMPPSNNGGELHCESLGKAHLPKQSSGQ